MVPGWNLTNILPEITAPRRPVYRKRGEVAEAVLPILPVDCAALPHRANGRIQGAQPGRRLW